RFGRGPGHTGLIELIGLTADDIAHSLPGERQIPGPERPGDSLSMLDQTAQADGKIQQQQLDGPADLRQAAQREGQEAQG
ncbi:hypothetical protein Q6288_28395, partial [Klebsiella quasipneumoniae]